MRYELLRALAVGFMCFGIAMTVRGIKVLQAYQVDEENITELYGEIPTNGKNEHSPLIRLVKNGYFFCSGVVIDGRYALTAAHCLTDTFGFMEREEVEIDNARGADTGVRAVPVAIDKLRDTALLKGNFENFESLVVDFDGTTPAILR